MDVVDEVGDITDAPAVEVEVATNASVEAEEVTTAHYDQEESATELVQDEVFDDDSDYAPSKNF